MKPTLCSKCKKNVAVIFITKIENGATTNEGLCLKCAKELGIKQVDDIVQRMGISDEDLDMLNGEMMQMMQPELDTDDGTPHYDVDFEKDKGDYDYEIHAETGKILKRDVPAKATTTSTTETKQLTKAEAQNIALKHAGFTADQVRDLEVELDKDDGTRHFDVDFEKDGYDYSYEIDAASGKILKSEKERD